MKVDSNATVDNRTTWYKSFLDQSKESTYYLPFIPGYWYGGNLDNMSLSLNATHESISESEYNLHNLYGHMMADHTYTYMTTNI